MEKKALIKGSGFRGVSVIDSACCAIFTFDAEGRVVSEIPTDGAGFDFWKLPDGNILYCHLGGSAGHGARVVTPENEIVTQYSSASEIFCCQPLEDGCFLVGELTEKQISVVSPAGKAEAVIPVKSIVSGHEVMRAARRLKDGTYMVVHPGDRALRRYSETGEVLSEFPTRADTFGVVEFGEDHFLYTAQTALVETDAEGREVRAVTAEDGLSGLGIHWLTGLQLLPDNHVILANWLGHGREGTGVPVFELDADGKLCWTLEAPDFTSDPANIQFDGLIRGK